VLTTLLDQIGSWPAGLVLAAAALVLAAESGSVFGVLLPGSTTLVVLGVWSAAAGTPPVLPIVVGAAASTSGALLGWYRGSRRQRYPAGQGRLRTRIDPAVRTARAWLADQRPGSTVVVLAVAHWAAVTRTLTPRVAGGAGVPLRLAGPVVAVSAAAWATTVVLTARALGEQVATDAGWVPAVVVGALAAVLAVRSWRHARRARVPTG
jgi:membrane-associated protein